MDPILRAADVCRSLSISVPTLYRWVRDGIFPPGIHYGPKCVGWPRQAVEAWLEQKSNSGRTDR